MRTQFILPIIAITSALTACSRAASETDQTQIVVEGDSLRFSSGALPDSVLTGAVSTQGSVPLILTGRVIWDEDRTVRFFTPFAGRVTKIAANLGDFVVSGASLAIVDSPEYGVAQTERRKASAEWQLARNNLTRTRDLHEHGVVADKDLQQAESAAASAEAEAQRAERVLAAYNDGGQIVDQRLSLRAPISGIVVERAINPGQELRPDQSGPALFVITDPSHLWLQLDAREDDLAALTPGTEFQFKTSAYPGEEFSGRVLRIADYVDPVTRTIKVLAAAINRGRLLKGELFVTATIPQPLGPAAEAPSTAIFLVGDKHYAFVREGDAFVRKQIRVGAEHAGRIAILDGVKAGDVLVTQGALYLQQTLQARAHG